MRAARFLGRGDIRVLDVPVREPGECEVLIRVRFCGVCGTDVHIFNGEKGSAAVTPPVTLGHEFSGEVLRVGAGVTG